MAVNNRQTRQPTAPTEQCKSATVYSILRSDDLSFAEQTFQLTRFKIEPLARGVTLQHLRFFIVRSKAMEFFVPLFTSLAIAAVLIALLVGLMSAPWQLLLLLLLAGLLGTRWLMYRSHLLDLPSEQATHPAAASPAEPTPAPAEPASAPSGDPVLIYRGVVYRQGSSAQPPQPPTA